MGCLPELSFVAMSEPNSHPTHHMEDSTNEFGVMSWDGSLASLNNSLSSSDLTSRQVSTLATPVIQTSSPPTACNEPFNSTFPSEAETYDSAQGLASSAPITEATATTSSAIDNSPNNLPRNLSYSQVHHSHPLASVLFSNVSPPGSPTSLASYPHTSDSAEGSPWLSDWKRRSREITGDTDSVNGSVAEQHGSELIMPSMRLPDAERPRDAAGRVIRPEPANFLVLGKSVDDRVAFVRLIDGQMGLGSNPSSDADLASSGNLSEGSRNSVKIGLTENFDDLLEEISHCTSGPTFFHPFNNALDLPDFTRRLTMSLERLEATLNPQYPATERLVDLISRGSCLDFEAVLMLFSSPPQAHEICLARAISQVIPVFPILVIPSSPKPQKTTALVRAVTQQFDAAGVQWNCALGSSSERNYRPLYLISSELLDDVHTPLSGNESMSSSQELSPPSPKYFNSQRYSTLSQMSDIRRLRLLVSSTSARQMIRRKRAISFLAWREVEVAARSQKPCLVSSLPPRWAERPISTRELHPTSTLDFSRRVAERRDLLESSKAASADSNLMKEVSESLYGINDTSSETQRQLRQRQHYARGNDLISMIPQDLTTPRCEQQLSTPASTSESSGGVLESEEHDFDPTNQSYFPHAASSSDLLGTYTPPLDRDFDPFHLPSLLHLVGLQLRMTLLPVHHHHHHHHVKMSRSDVGFTPGWIRTAVVLGLFFVGGLVCGSGSLGRAFGQIWRGSSSNSRQTSTILRLL